MDSSTKLTFGDADFCALTHTLEAAYPLMSSEQMLEMADKLHEAIRLRHEDPKSSDETSCERAAAGSLSV